MSSTPSEGPCVIVVGAGLAGLLLGALLEKAGIEYHIFERAAKVKPLGSAMTLGPTILPALEQLGLLEELQKISHPITSLNVVDMDLNPLGSVKLQRQKEISGFDNVILARPDFYDLLLRQVPAHRLYMGKRILQVKEKDDKVVIHCSDNTDYDCDILVGADGAYSATRQNIYRDMDEAGTLSSSDKENLVAASLCMVGVTDALDPEEYPQLKDPFVNHRRVHGGSNHTWSMYNVPGNRICWGYTVRFENPEEAKRQQFANSEWGPESIEPMLKQLYDQPCPYSKKKKMGDIIDVTQRGTISKVFLEHKLFKTWFHGRTVLIGDACHKMLPSAGLGAVNAMQDAVILANCLYDLKSNSQEDVTVAFQEYYDQRYPQTKLAYDASLAGAKLMNGQKWHEKIARHVIFNYLPDSFQEARLAKSHMYRPQASFLPTVPFRGSAAVLPLIPSERYERERVTKKASGPVAVSV